MNPLVLAIPVYNASEFLPATLQSLREQGSNVRWWLQDANSSDDTVAIAERLARPGDTIISERDAGQADAINRAFSRMGGEIIGFLNGDDTLTPGTAERVLEFFRLNPHVDLIYGCVEWIDRDDRVTGFHAGNIQSLTDVLDIYNVWWSKRQWVQPEVFYRRSLFEKVGPFDTKLRLAFDYDFWVRCFRAGAVVAHTPAITVQFRIHSAQKSVAAEQAADEIRSIVQRNLPSAEIPWAQRVRISAALSYDYYQSGKDLPTGTDRPPFLKAILTHPHWLLSPLVRERAQSSLAKMTSIRRRNK